MQRMMRWWCDVAADGGDVNEEEVVVMSRKWYRIARGGDCGGAGEGGGDGAVFKVQWCMSSGDNVVVGATSNEQLATDMVVSIRYCTWLSVSAQLPPQ